MKKAVKLLVLCDLLFLVIMALSGIFSGIASDVIYILGFAIPTALGLAASRNGYEPYRGDGIVGDDEDAGASEYENTGDIKIGINRAGLLRFLPTVFPTLLSILLLSLLTSLILGTLGFTDTSVIEGSLPAAIISSAILPALLEEALFRYLPIKLLAPHSPRGAVMLSSAFFALAHLDFYRLPYAFFAGFVFISLDMLTGSILPSVTIHFINNLMSVFLWFYPGSLMLKLIYIGLLVVMSVVSVIVIIKHKGDYKRSAERVFNKGDIGGMYTAAPLAFILPTLVITVLNLFAK